MDNFKFVSSSGLIASVLEDLSSYDANNQLDPGRWYPWIEKIVSDLGVAVYEIRHELVYVDNHKGKIESCGFYILDSAFRVSDHCHGGAPGEGPIHYQGRNIIWDDTTTSCTMQRPGCEGDCDFRTCTLDSFNQITVREYVQGLPYNYEVPILHPLFINQRVAKGWCLPQSICFGAKSKEEITISHGEVFTNFPKGMILLNYYVFPYGEDGLPQIPDQPKIMAAVEWYVKWKTLETMWINNDDMGIEKKMQYAKDLFWNMYYPDAEFLVKLTDLDGMYDIARNFRRRYSCMQLMQK